MIRASCTILFRSVTGMLLAGGIGLTSGASAPNTVSDGRLKATLLLQVVHYVEWPQTAWASSAQPFTICLRGAGRLADRIAELARTEAVLSRPVRVTTVRRQPELASCHVLLDATPTDAEPWGPQSPVLTVGEDEAFTRSGGMVGLVVAEGRVVLELNRAAAERVGLRFSSRLLRLSRLVGEERH